MTTDLPEPVKPVMVIEPLLVVKVSWACITAGNASRRSISNFMVFIFGSVELFNYSGFGQSLFVLPSSNQNCLWLRRLGFCWAARPSRLPFSASRRKPVSQTEWFHRWFGRDARTRTRDARAPPVRPTQTAFGRSGWGRGQGQSLQTATLRPAFPMPVPPRSRRPRARLSPARRPVWRHGRAQKNLRAD